MRSGESEGTPDRYGYRFKISSRTGRVKSMNASSMDAFSSTNTDTVSGTCPKSQNSTHSPTSPVGSPSLNNWIIFMLSLL